SNSPENECLQNRSNRLSQIAPQLLHRPLPEFYRRQKEHVRRRPLRPCVASQNSNKSIPTRSAANHQSVCPGTHSFLEENGTGFTASRSVGRSGTGGQTGRRGNAAHVRS